MGRVVFLEGRALRVRTHCAVELFAQDVGVSGVPAGLGEDVDHDGEQFHVGARPRAVSLPAEFGAGVRVVGRLGPLCGTGGEGGRRSSRIEEAGATAKEVLALAGRPIDADSRWPLMSLSPLLSARVRRLARSRWQAS